MSIRVNFIKLNFLFNFHKRVRLFIFNLIEVEVYGSVVGPLYIFSLDYNYED